MSDLAKFITVIVLAAAGWFIKDYREGEARKFNSEAGQKLQMVQGAKPADGKPIVLEFWGTYCGPCVASIPHMNELYAKYGQKVQFIAVSAENTQKVRDFMTQRAMQYPVAIDPTHDFFRQWEIKSVPTLIYLNASRKEKWRGHAMQFTEEQLKELMGE